ncbi:uncharacterized protein J3R85_012161 [Psidium guajava]|nr:uncharacterized protein J3R85_012161 [Psidium guajava]
MPSSSNFLFSYDPPLKLAIVSDYKDEEKDRKVEQLLRPEERAILPDNPILRTRGKSSQLLVGTDIFAIFSLACLLLLSEVSWAILGFAPSALLSRFWANYA